MTFYVADRPEYSRARRPIAAVAIVFVCACSSPTTLDGAVVVSNPVGLKLVGLDATNLYWTNYPNVYPPSAVNDIYETPKSGGQNTKLGQTSITANLGGSIGIDATNIYFPLNDTIVAAPIAGGSSRIVATGTTTTSVAVANGNLYWVDDQGAGKSLPVAGGTPSLLSLPTDAPRDGSSLLAVAYTDAVYVSYPSGIARFPFDAEASTWFSVQYSIGLAIDDANIYTIVPQSGGGGTGTSGSTGEDNVVAIPKAGGAPVTLTSGQTLYGIAIDSQSVYFTDNTRVMKVPKSGGSVTVLANNQEGPSGVRVDDSNAYWDEVGNGTIKSVAK
jgi:hypothetical protein